jgi:hypothetical protein
MKRALITSMTAVLVVSASAASANAQYRRDVTIVGPYGGVTQRQITRSYDPVTGAYSRSAQTIGPRGRVYTRNTSGIAKDGQINGQTTVNGPVFGTRSFTYSAVRR